MFSLVICLTAVFCFSGVYLASVIYHEDRVAMTTEDFLPVLEVDESYPSSIHADFHWLMKVRRGGPSVDHWYGHVRNVYLEWRSIFHIVVHRSLTRLRR